MQSSKSLSVWPLVAVLGLAYLALEVGAQGLTATHAVGLGSGVLRVRYVPRPADLVSIDTRDLPPLGENHVVVGPGESADLYQVPDGKCFVLTDLQLTPSTTNEFRLAAVGAQGERTILSRPHLHAMALHQWAQGKLFHAGESVVLVSEETADTLELRVNLTGYLADAN